MREYLGRNALESAFTIIKQALAGKQNKLTGTVGQVVGFNADGDVNALTIEATDGLVGTQSDSRYQISGKYKAPSYYIYDGLPSITDFLQVDILGPNSETNQTRVIEGELSNFTNVPPTLTGDPSLNNRIICLREVMFIYARRVIVKLTELYPEYGRTFYNHFNYNDWMGWVETGPIGVLPIANGGTGNNQGYVRAGQESGTTIGNRATAEGLNTTASGDSSHAEGVLTTANNYASHAGGHRNKAMIDGGTANNTTGDALVIGNGVSNDSLSNCFRVTYAGEVYGLSAFNSTGADYAEYFEWADGNPDAEDRVGYFVTLRDKKLRLAQPGDYVLGIVSGQPCIIGNADEDWLGRWEHDEFGRFIKENVESGGWRYKANPDYDASQPYMERKDRPEWSAVGMLGVLCVRDDGSCQTNGFCTLAKDGTAIAAENYIPGQTWLVMERVTPNVVKVVFR